MVLSVRDVELLCLIRWCKYIPANVLVATFSRDTIDDLVTLGLIRFLDTKKVYLLTSRGHDLLQRHIESIPAFSRPSYTDGDILRRGRVAQVTLTAYRAGMSVFQTDINGVKKTMTFYMTALSRRMEMNPWGSSRAVAVCRLGDRVCAVHYVCPGIGRISLQDEQNLFLNNITKVDTNIRGFIFAGESYESVLAELSIIGKKSPTGLITYGATLQKIKEPIYVLECSETGALQLQIMGKPGYRELICRGALGDKYQPPPEGHPEWDAMCEGAPLIVGVDMNMRRLQTAIKSARSEGYPMLNVIGLKGQTSAVLWQRYGAEDFVRPLSATPSILEDIGVGKLYQASEEQFKNRKGEVIHASFVKAT